MEEPKKNHNIYKERIFHLDVRPYQPFEASVYLDKDFGKKHLNEDRAGLRAIITSRLRNNQSLNVPIETRNRWGKVKFINNYCGMQVDFTQSLFTPLKVAARSDFFLDITQFLLAHGADPNYQHKKLTALQIAVLYGSAKTVKVLLNAGARCKDQLLLHACPPLKHEIFSLLLAHRTDPNESCGKCFPGCGSINRGNQSGSHYFPHANSLFCLISKLDWMCIFRDPKPSEMRSIIKSAILLLDAGANSNYFEGNTNIMLENLAEIHIQKMPHTYRRDLLIALKNHGAWKAGAIDNNMDQLIEYVFKDEKEKLLTLSNNQDSYFRLLPHEITKTIVDLYRNS